MLTVLPKQRYHYDHGFTVLKKWDSGRASKFAWGHTVTKQNWNYVSLPCPYSHNHQAAHFPHPWSQPWGLGLTPRMLLGLVSCSGAWALHQSLVPVPSHWSPCTAAFQASWELCPCHRLSSGGQHSFSENRGHASRWVSLLLSAPISEPSGHHTHLMTPCCPVLTTGLPSKLTTREKGSGSNPTWVPASLLDWMDTRPNQGFY